MPSDTSFRAGPPPVAPVRPVFDRAWFVASCLTLFAATLIAGLLFFTWPKPPPPQRDLDELFDRTMFYSGAAPDSPQPGEAQTEEELELLYRLHVERQKRAGKK